MLRLAALLLVGVLAMAPLTVLPAAPVTWLAALALAVGGAGALACSGPLVTAGASLAVVGYALALVIERPAVDAVGAAAFGATLVLALTVAHFAARVRGAVLQPGVLAAQVRSWLAVALAGSGVALAVAVGAGLLAPFLAGARLPLIVGAAALGASLTAAGVVRALLSR